MTLAGEIEAHVIEHRVATMQGGLGTAQLASEMHIAIGHRQAGVPQQVLELERVAAGQQKVRGKGVPQ
jgi:hypothetical protein